MYTTTHYFRSLIRNSHSLFSNIQFNRTQPQYKNTQDVQLRGVVLKGNYNDLPNLIFLPEAFDTIENWIPFFTNNQILNHRNVHIITPRNFGNSDRNESFDIEEVAADVQRYMWQNKLSTATLAGHGYGGKVALAAGCYHSERSTGVFVVDSSPMDQRYHEAFHELKGYVNSLKNLQIPNDRAHIEKFLKEEIKCPKWRSLFSQNLIKSSTDKYEWKFALDHIHKNLSFNKADSIGYWPVKAGLYSGRAWFVFPEYSRWVHLGTNTLPMMKICPRVKGFGHDIHSIPGDENTQNHWMYDFEDQSFALSRKFIKFLSMYDGVHVLLQDRTEVGKAYIPDRKDSRNKEGHIYSDYSPAHYHHNWRYNDIYKQ